jgi:hypothetical protein
VIAKWRNECGDSCSEAPTPAHKLGQARLTAAEATNLISIYVLGLRQLIGGVGGRAGPQRNLGVSSKPTLSHGTFVRKHQGGPLPAEPRQDAGRGPPVLVRVTQCVQELGQRVDGAGYDPDNAAPHLIPVSFLHGILSCPGWVCPSGRPGV